MKETKAFCDVCGEELLNLNENFTVTWGAASRDSQTKMRFHVCTEDLRKLSISQIIAILKQKSHNSFPYQNLYAIEVDPPSDLLEEK